MTTKTVKGTAFVVRDQAGNCWSAVVGDLSDTVQVYGLFDKQGNTHFEAEAYHLQDWADFHGFKVDRQEFSVEVNLAPL